MLLEITRLPLNVTPPGNIFCTIFHRLSNTGAFIIDSTNIEVQPDGYLVNPFFINISAPPGTTVTIRAKSNCGTVNVDKTMTIPAVTTTTTTTTSATTTTTTTAATTTTTTSAATTTTTTAGTTTTTTTSATTTTTTTAATTTTTTSGSTTTTTTSGSTTTTTTSAGTTTTTTSGTTTTTTTSAGTTTTTTAATTTTTTSAATTTTTTAGTTTTTTTAATTTTTTTAATTTTTTAATTTTTTTGTTTTTTTAPPPDSARALYLSGTENGDNTFTLRWNVNRARLTGTKFLLGLQGSSTANGTGSADPNNLPGYLQSWLTSNTAGGLLLRMATNGFDTRNFMTEGNNVNVKLYQNVDAGLTLRMHAVIVSLPTNDIINGVSVSQYVANLQAIWNLYMAQGVACFIETTQPRDSATPTQQTQLKQAAQLIRDTFPHEFVIDVFDYLRDPGSATDATIWPPYSANDAIHVNAAGHQVIATFAERKILDYFKDYTYIEYQIERSSTSATTGFTLFDTVTGGTNIEKTYNRVDGQQYWYRVRGKRADNSLTDYTNVRSIYQPIQVINVNQTIQVNLGNNVDAPPPSDWNNWVGSVSAQQAVGTTLANLKDSTGATTSVGLVVTKKFDAAVGGGAPVTDAFPAQVTRNSWPARAGFLDYSQMKFTALNQNWAYELQVLTGIATSNNVVLGVRVRNQDDKENFEFASGYPVNGNANTGRLIILKGLIPDVNGELLIDFVPVAMYGDAYVNGFVLKRYQICSAVTDIQGELLEGGGA